MMDPDDVLMICRAFGTVMILIAFALLVTA
jgi:hypothetical protein